MIALSVKSAIVETLAAAKGQRKLVRNDYIDLAKKYNTTERTIRNIFKTYETFGVLDRKFKDGKSVNVSNRSTAYEKSLPTAVFDTETKKEIFKDYCVNFLTFKKINKKYKISVNQFYNMIKNILLEGKIDDFIIFDYTKNYKRVDNLIDIVRYGRHKKENKPCICSENEKVYYEMIIDILKRIL